MKWIAVSFILLSVYSFGQTGATATIQSLEKTLTNGNIRQWTLEGTKVFLGGGDTCSAGELLKFSLNTKIVEKKTCMNGKWVSNYFAWKIEYTNTSIIPVLNFYDRKKQIIESFKVQMINKDNKIYLRLRKTGSANEETIDLYFK